MAISEHIRASLELPALVVRGYLEDLEDADLFVRPHPKMNHIAWQLGHLIVGENFHIAQVARDEIERLPSRFVEMHSKEAASKDDPSAFCDKVEYLRQMDEQRKKTLAVLDRMSDEELSQPSPDAIRYFGPTVGSVFAGEATHWMMHAGQWAVIRRSLGKPPLY